MTQTPPETEREAFEKWAIDFYRNFKPEEVRDRTKQGDYRYFDLEWRGWQARAALSAAPVDAPSSVHSAQALRIEPQAPLPSQSVDSGCICKGNWRSGAGWFETCA